ncbi:MAG: urease accessory protein UreD [Leptolyngbya sp. DLM2.Bin15]|nr:MAG: urease accessory protein UreD [Leptolyngbya sp. DLM2.Bin15]
MTTAPIASHRPTGWHGQLHLSFDTDDTGRTYLAHRHARAPYKIQRPFYPEDGVCHGVMLHTAGGIVGGDRLSTTVDLAPHTHALLTTAAANKLYGSAGETATQSVTLTLGAGAWLEWLPQELIVFQGGRLHQTIRVELGEQALWLGWEITRFGRTARQETFTEGEWRSHTEVWQQGKPLWIDPQWLPASADLLTSPHGLAGYPVVGSFAILGRSPQPDQIERARSLWAELHQVGDAGVTQLQSGYLCRYRGPSSSAARRWFTQVWQDVRQTWSDRPPCMPRVWPR